MAKQIQLPKEYPIPCNWKWVEIGELVFMRSGYPFDSKRFSSESEGRKPLIRIRNVVRGETDTYTDEDCPAEYTIHYGDVLIGMDGDFNVAKWKSEDGLLNQRVCYICSSSDALLNDYMFYYLPDPLKKINDVTPSVTVKHLSTKTIEKTSIPLPPLAEQQRIVDRIESLFAKLDEAKEKAQAVIDGFEDRKAAILHKAFTGELTAEWRKENGISVESWSSQSLKESCTIGSGGTPSRKSPDYYNGDIPWVKTGEIDWNDIYNTEEHISLIATNNSSAKVYSEGAVLVAMYGMGVTRGRAAILKVKAATNQAVCVLQPKEYLMNRYLFYYFMCNYWDIREQAVGGNQLNLSGTIISKFIINIPSVDEQSEIITILDSLFEKEQRIKEAAEQVIDQIDSMKKSILARAFRGELGTNDPADESAVELLKRTLLN